MKNRINWLYLTLLGGVIAVAGCGGGSSTPGPPILTMYSSSADFGDVAVGNTMTLGVIFSNTGGTPLTLQQNSVSGAGFSTSGIGTGVTLGPGQYVTLAVSFNPPGTGKASGMASVSSSTLTSPISLSLSGNGVVATHWAAFDWAASPSGVVGYNVYTRSNSDTTWTKLNSSPVTTSSYTDWDVQSGESYIFGVTAVNAANVESRLSNVALATIPSQ